MNADMLPKVLLVLDEGPQAIARKRTDIVTVDVLKAYIAGIMTVRMLAVYTGSHPLLNRSSPLQHLAIEQKVTRAKDYARGDEPPRLPPEQQGGHGAAQGHQPAERRDPAVQSGQRRWVGAVRAVPRQSHVDHLVHVHAVRLSGRLALNRFSAVHG